MKDSRPAIGKNIATLRKAKGFTQEAVAAAAAVSLSLLKKIEAGSRPASPPVVAALAKALGTTTFRLYGTALDPLSGIDMDAVRAAVRRYDLPGPVPGGVTAATGPALAARLAAAAEMRAETRYRELAEALPALILDTTAFAHAATEPAGWTMMADALGCAYTLAHRLGQADLAEAITARQEWAANQMWTPVALAAAHWNRAGTFQSAGDYGTGMALVEDAIIKLEAANVPEIEAAATLGALHLRAVTLSARAKDANSTADHLAHAGRLAELLPDGDMLVHNLTFGSGNTFLHDMAAKVELDRPDEAVDMAEAFVPGPTLKPTRVCHFHIDAARAYLEAGDTDAALLSLDHAHRVAPQLAAVHPMALDTGRVAITRKIRSNDLLLRVAEAYRLDL